MTVDRTAPTSPPATTEYAVRCTDGWTTAPLDIPDPARFASYLDGVDTHRRCGPHRVVQRTISPWTEVTANA